MTIPDEVERAAREPSDAELANYLRFVAQSWEEIHLGKDARGRLRLAAQRLEARGEISEAMVEAVRQRLRERGYTEIGHFVIGLVLRHAAALSGKEE